MTALRSPLARRGRSTALLLSSAALCAAVGLTTAPAASAKPAVGCAGLQIEDARGDVTVLAGPTATNLDITGGFFNTDPAGVVTANIQIAEMSVTPPPPATAVAWFMTWLSGNTRHFVSLEADITGATLYEYGVVEENEAGGTSYAPSGETKGQVFEGPDGFISIVVPKGAKGTVGSKLEAPTAESFQLVQNTQGGGVLLFGDDTGEGTEYTVGQCELGGGGGGTGGPVGPVTPPTVNQPRTAASLPLTLVSKSARAKGRTLTVKVRAGEALTDVVAKLKRGAKTVGTGRLATMDAGSTGALKLRLKGRKPRRGTYTLQVTGSTAAGTAARSFSLRVR